MITESWFDLEFSFGFKSIVYLVISNFAFLGTDRAEKANSNLAMKFDRHQFGAKLHWKQNQDDLYMRGANNNLLIVFRLVLELLGLLSPQRSN